MRWNIFFFLQLAFSRAVRAAWSRTFISVKWEDGFIIGCSKKCCKIEAIWFHVDLKFHVKLLVGLFFLIFLSSLFWSFQVFLWEFSESLVLCVTLCVVNNLCSGGFWMGGCFNDLMGHSKDSFYWEPMAAIWKIWGCHFIAGGDSVGVFSSRHVVPVFTLHLAVQQFFMLQTEYCTFSC